MTFAFPQLIAHLARTRELEPAASSARARLTRKPTGRGRPAAQGGVGYSCIAEQRVVETILAARRSPVHALRRTASARDAGRSGASVFGAIDQVVRQDRRADLRRARSGRRRIANPRRTPASRRALHLSRCRALTPRFRRFVAKPVEAAPPGSRICPDGMRKCGQPGSPGSSD